MIILHPGMPKTGTTSLQMHLNRHRSALMSAGMLYPETGCDPGTGNHLPFVEACISGGGGFAALAGDLHTEIAAKRPRVTTISSERLWNRRVCGRDVLERLGSVFAGQEVKVLIGLRELRAHALSGYQQRVKGRQRFAGNFLEHFLKGEADGVWDYAGRLDDFAEVFGTEAIRPYSYEAFRSDLLAPLTRLAGVPEIGHLGEMQSSNRSPGWFDIRFRRFGNRVGTKVPPVRSAVVWSAGLLERSLFSRLGDRDLFKPISPDAEALLDQIGSARMAKAREAYDMTWAT